PMTQAKNHISLTTTLPKLPTDAQAWINELDPSFRSSTERVLTSSAKRASTGRPTAPTSRSWRTTSATSSCLRANAGATAVAHFDPNQVRDDHRRVRALYRR
ncbi:MAG: hypothetical protein WBZ67_13050, partial [Pseudolabrys sp.]